VFYGTRQGVGVGWRKPVGSDGVGALVQGLGLIGPPKLVQYSSVALDRGQQAGAVGPDRGLIRLQPFAEPRLRLGLAPLLGQGVTEIGPGEACERMIRHGRRHEQGVNAPLPACSGMRAHTLPNLAVRRRSLARTGP